MQEMDHIEDEVAIIGMAGRFPGARDLHELWQNLCNGEESITFFSDQELQKTGVPANLLNDPHYVKACSALEDIEGFDASFFNYSPREAEVMDPQHRLLLECAWAALENAGYDIANSSGERVGIYAGGNISAYLLFNLMSNPQILQALGTLQTVIDNDKDHLVTRVAYKLNLKGPCISVTTACSTSLVAVHLACESLLNGESDMMLAGGVSVIPSQKEGYMHREGETTSPDGHCRAFDAHGQGTVFGSGVGMVVLKRLEDALKDGDYIHAVIKGSAINNDGSQKVGYTAPSIEGQAEVIAKAQAIANVSPETINYIEAHGTGTPLGDPIEVAALTRAFRLHTQSQNFCGLGSVKTNFGHLGAASGIAGLIKTVLALGYKKIPPSLNFEQPNPRIDFVNSPFYVNTKLCPWPIHDIPRRAGVSSFGIGGTNAHIVLEEAPKRMSSGPSRPWQLLLLSAKTSTALEAATARLCTYLQHQPNVPLADVAYTLQMGRQAFRHRRFFVSSDASDAINALQVDDLQRMQSAQVVVQERPLIFLFPGQGAQYVQMAGDLYQSEPFFRQQVDRCADLLMPYLMHDIRNIIYPSASLTEHASQLLSQTYITQPSLFVIEYALAQLWMEWGIRPQAMLGHSLGEYVAACLAGVFSLEDALMLVVARGRLMQQVPQGATLAIFLSAQEIEPLLSGDLCLAANNGPAFCAVAGPLEQIDEFRVLLEHRQVENRLLHVTRAAHSSMMEPIIEPYMLYLQRVKFHEPQIPYISNVTGKWITNSEATDPGYWAKHIRQTVHFTEGVSLLIQELQPHFLEVGPGRTLNTFVRQHQQSETGHIHLSTLRHPRELQSDVAFFLATLGHLWLAGYSVQWSHFWGDEQRLRLPLPAYSFDHQHYWIDPQQYSIDEDSAHQRSLETTSDRANWLYLSGWKRYPCSTVQHISNAQSTRWIIWQDGSSVGHKLVHQMRLSKHTVIEVLAGGRFMRLDDWTYSLNPTRREEYQQLTQTLREEFFPARVVYLWGLVPSVQENEERRQMMPSETLIQSATCLLYVAQALNVYQEEHEVQLEVVTSQSQAITGQEVISPESAAIQGICRVIPQEYARIRLRCTDIALPPADGREEQRLCDLLMAQWSEPAVAMEEMVAYRGASRWVQTIDRVHLDQDFLAAPVLQAQEVYLMIGGLDGLGLLFASYLVQEIRARLILLEPQKLPARHEWDGVLQQDGSTPVSQRIRALQSLEAQGGEFLLINAESMDTDQLYSALIHAQEQFGQIRGIIHNPSMPAPLSISEIVTGKVEDTLQAALSMLYLLPTFLDNENLDFCVSCVPLDAFVGKAEYALQSTLHHFMNALAFNYNKKHTIPWTIISWSSLFDAAQSLSGEHASLNIPLTHKDIGAIFAQILALSLEDAILISPVDLCELRTQPVYVYHNKPQRLNTTNFVVDTASEAVDAESSVVPNDSVEQTIMKIWQEVLGVKQVSTHDNFFELGGHSLLATQILSRLRDALHLELSMRQLFELPTVSALADHIKTLQQSIQKPEDLPLVPISRDRDLPLSFPQQRLWFLEQLEASSSYNVPASIRIANLLDIEALERCFNAIVQRHEVLRTTFVATNGLPVQVIAPTLTIPLRTVDLRNIAEAEREKEIARLAITEARFPFDLAHGPLMRTFLLILAEGEYVLLLTMHHIVSDGWSVGVLVQEIAAFYEAFSRKQSASVPALSIQYADFAYWQRRRLQGKLWEEHVSYWRKQLHPSSYILNLPTDRHRPPIQSFRGTVSVQILPHSLADNLNALSRAEGVTLFMTLLAAFELLLHRYTQQRYISVGTPVVNRNRLEMEKLIGFFVNTLVLSTDMSGQPSFLELLARVREVALGAYAHEDLPFEKLVEELQPERDLSRTPLFQVMFALQNNVNALPAIEGMTLNNLNYNNGTAKFDLSLDMSETMDGLVAEWEYSTDLFDDASIFQMQRHFQTLLEGIVATPEQNISTLSLLQKEEIYSLTIWGSPQKQFATGQRIDQLIDVWVESTPDAVALVLPATPNGQEDGAFLTYRELNQRAQQVALYLQDIGVGPEGLVGIYMERSLEMIVAVLGVLKAGAAYVPLDTLYSKERLQLLLENTQLPLLLLQKQYLHEIPESYSQVVCLDAIWEWYQDGAIIAPVNEALPDNLAYVVYTSGSTGEPKGIMVSHRNLVNAYYAWEDTYMLSSTCHAHLQMASFAFDVFSGDMVRALCSGGKLVLCPRDVLIAPQDLYTLMRHEYIDCAEFVPAVMRILLQYLEQTEQCIDFMQVLAIGSDSWYMQEYQAVRCRCNPCTRLINSYGVSEATIDTLFFEDSGPASSTTDTSYVPIGNPFANSSIYVLDAYLQYAPIGVPGELYISGAGITYGYLGLPERTAESFIPHPFSSIPGERLYKTGDLVRYRRDGVLEFIGRSDYQIKMRGFRIELGEIESVLNMHTDVSENVVLVHEDTLGNKKLVAYVVPKAFHDLQAREVANHLKERLPLYMVPSSFILLKEIPLNANGKLDRLALPEPKQSGSGQRYALPRSETERKIAAIWQKLLDIEDVSIYDNFFELGGHSLLVTQLIFQLNHTFKIVLSLRNLFEVTDLSELAQVVDDLQRTGTSSMLASTDTLHLENEVNLDPSIEISPDVKRLAGVVIPQIVFLTGATGFLGAYLLNDLLQQTQATIYCLVRSANEADGLLKLQQNLETYALWQDAFRSRIIPIPGDLSQPLFGLSVQEFSHLAQEIDSIYHCGAWVNFTYPYSALKATNVLSTQEVLRLASQFKMKSVHFISTLNVFPPGGYTVSEDDALQQSESLVNGYAQSKWVAEKLLQIARSRGFPISVYRLGLLAGDNRTGIIHTEDMVWAMIRGCVQIGYVPDIEMMLDLTPVDYVSKAIIHLSLQEQTQDRAFHIVNPEKISFSELVYQVRSLGYTLQEVPYGQWQETLFQEVSRDKRNALSPFMPLFPKQPQEQKNTVRIRSLEVDCQNAYNALASSSIYCPPVNATLLEKYFVHFMQSGFLPMPEQMNVQ